MDEDIKIKRKKRNKIKQRIKTYARKKYDARPLIGEYLRLTEELEQMGDKHWVNLPCLTKEYWDDPANRCHRSKIKTAINCIDGIPIYEKIRNIIPAIEADYEDIFKYFKITITIPSSTNKQLIDYIYNYCFKNGFELINTTSNGVWLCILYQIRTDNNIDSFKIDMMKYIQQLNGFISIDKII